MIYLDISGFVSKIRSTGGDIVGIVALITNSAVDELAALFPSLKETRPTLLSDALMGVTSQTGDQFVFIIDEWKAVFREAASRTDVQDAYMNFLRDLFKNGNVTDTVIAAAYMTGISPPLRYREVC